MPVLALSEDEGELILPSGQEILPEEQDGLELDAEALDGLEGLDDLSMDLDLSGNADLEIAGNPPALGDPAEADGAGAEENALAANDWEYEYVTFVNSEGDPLRQQDPLRQ